VTRPALVPELYVTDLSASIAFYVDLLGFQIEYARRAEKFVALSLGTAHLMLEEAPSLKRATSEEFEQGQWRTADFEKPFGRGINFEIQIDDVERVNHRLIQHDYPFLRPLHEKSYRVGTESRNVRQLLLADPDGYLIRLSQPLRPDPFAG
jgi:catechol 2,3-dioxygenase-like lactoylglutathione lyase family enzyme